MKIFGANISQKVSDLLSKKLSKITEFHSANQLLSNAFNIKHFFESQDEFSLFKEAISVSSTIVEEPDRAEYGDFQTNLDLAKLVMSFLKEKKIKPSLIIEPTCGKGNFIIAALEKFPEVENIIGVEIYKPYVWETKFNILHFHIENPKERKPVIDIHHFNVFDFDFKNIIKKNPKAEILVVGNPPWVTNSKLSILESDNLPKKSNFKKHTGLDAITGKGNFDIGEYITLMMLDAFQHTSGHLAFLVKNSVIKNVVFSQKQNSYKVSGLQKQTIDSAKEFNVSVDAALFYCKLNTSPEFKCMESNFYTQKELNGFGWVNDKFVSNIELYDLDNNIDGICPFVWRQGIKHDLSSIMEFEKYGRSLCKRS